MCKTHDVVEWIPADGPNSPFVTWYGNIPTNTPIDKITMYKGPQPVTPVPDKFVMICPECNGTTMVKREDAACKHCDFKWEPVKDETEEG